jgi:hypothetical protein
VYHGGGGFIHSEVYNMPIWMRKFHIQKINEYNKKQNDEFEKSQGKSNIGDGEISRPNINPSSIYNFDK